MSAHDEQQAKILDLLSRALVIGLRPIAGRTVQMRNVEPDEIQALQAGAAALRRASPETGWQPIETAPKDQRRVLVGYYNIEGVWREFIAFWALAYESAPASQCYWRTDGGGTLLSSDIHRGGSSGKPLGATHWQPLPPAPRPQEG